MKKPHVKAPHSSAVKLPSSCQPEKRLFSISKKKRRIEITYYTFAGLTAGARHYTYNLRLEANPIWDWDKGVWVSAADDKDSREQELYNVYADSNGEAFDHIKLWFRFHMSYSLLHVVHIGELVVVKKPITIEQFMCLSLDQFNKAYNR